jgi:hypothetical protein
MLKTDRSLQQIKRETEQTRAGLTDTVEQLKSSVAETATDIRQRISPEAIKAEVSGYIKSRGEQLLNDVSASARKNPMQAVAVGASIAYPLLRLARAIPTPVLLVGAGLFFAGSKTGQAATQRASDVATDLSADVKRRANEFAEQVQDTASSAQTYASDQLDRMSSALAGGSDRVKEAADAAGSAIAEKAQEIKDAAASTSSALSDRAKNLTNDGLRTAGSAANTVQGMINSASTAIDTGMNGVSTMGSKAQDAAERAGKSVFETIEQNPLLVAGLGLLVGGLIASALPRSDFEDDLIGDASTATKRRAQAAASQGFDAAKTAVGEVCHETARQADAEGLTGDQLGKAAQDISQRVRRVAEAAVTTAFEPSQDDHEPKALGENDNG